MREFHLRATVILITTRSAVIRSNTTMLFTVFGAAFGMQLYVPAEYYARKVRMLNKDNRAFDTGSEKVWNGLNKGVSKTLGDRGIDN